MDLGIKKQQIPTLEQSMNGLLFGGNGDIKQIDINKLIPYQNQPFKAYKEDSLKQLAEDIKINGVINPIIVRPLNDKFQILSGHNRVNACKIAELSKVPCIIKNINDTDANLILTSSNFNQRKSFYPSEKALGYKLQEQSLKSKFGDNAPIINIMAEANDTNRKEIYRYLSLANLTEDLLALVDDKIINLNLGINLSQRPKEEQELVLNFLKDNQIKKISSRQVTEIINIDKLSETSLNNIFSSPFIEKQKVKKISISKDIFETYFTPNDTEAEIQEIVDVALKKYFGQ